jgi:aspartate/methionine/tyrosine aminotransferase
MDKSQLLQKYNEIKSRGLSLDMSRGKPGCDVLTFSENMLSLPGDNWACKPAVGGIAGAGSARGCDCRNYGVLDGIPEAKELFAPIHGVSPKNIIIGGNSSLQMMYDTITRAMLAGVGEGEIPWANAGKNAPIKFLCPVPGYDRHFSICESLGIEMLNVPMNDDGPDMDIVEELVGNDECIKGIWCVPMYSNPTGITFSDETVRRFARMKTAAADFRIFWDNAYAVHHLSDTPDVLANIFDECVSAGNPDRVYMFASTSKITFPGSGIGIMAASDKNAAFIRKHMSFQTIGSDKLNQLRHVQFFKDYSGITAHMKKLQSVLKPKFDAVLEILERELTGFGEWHAPNGGYFISFNSLKKSTAKKTVQLCKNAGVVLTGAGATFPYGNDPDDINIRIAPTFPPLDELREAMEVFCVSVKLAALE